MKEIERKFILKEFPESLARDAVEVRQGYITQPGDSVEVRLRQKGAKFLITCKTGSGMTREERESEIAPDIFENIWPMSDGRRIQKTRYKVSLPGDLTAEVDLFEEDLLGLRLCEVEFPNEAVALAFIPPEWFGKEVTDDPSYKNQQLAVNGLKGDE